ncbi:hypothetical protein HC891_05160 [Candidatus Gracilibacteria bacterium]|nr:hypothetical protein [Candidatus Gracilibacteria bacterium]
MQEIVPELRRCGRLGKRRIEQRCSEHSHHTFAESLLKGSTVIRRYTERHSIGRRQLRDIQRAQGSQRDRLVSATSDKRSRAHCAQTIVGDKLQRLGQARECSIESSTTGDNQLTAAQHPVFDRTPLPGRELAGGYIVKDQGVKHAKAGGIFRQLCGGKA